MAVRFKIIFVFLFISTIAACADAQSYRPVVLWHGMGGNSEGRSILRVIIKTLHDELPGVHVKSLQIGDSQSEDVLNSFFLNVNKQIEKACDLVTADPKLKNGFNAVGFSQGGQFLRALAQRCPEAHMRTLITLGGQHQGIYGLPHCPEHNIICDVMRRSFSWFAYYRLVQNRLVQAQYWKDPRNLESYIKYNTFLADINNEGPVKNESYARNLAALEKFVMVRFNKDEMVRPVESQWFGFYTPGQAKEVQPMNETTLYKEDWLGLKGMNERGALHFLQVDSGHVRITIKWFKSEIIDKYLK